MDISKKIIKVIFVLLVFLLTIATWTTARIWSENIALEKLNDDATLIARQQTRLVDSELAKFRLLPTVLKEYSDLNEVLDGGQNTATQRLNKKLNFLAQEIGSPIIYVIKNDGTVVASSNANTPESFMGRNYGFRPYFKGSMSAGAAEYYAIGDLSGRFGLFIAKRIGDETTPKGVVVVKFEFNQLVSTWANDPGQTFVVDPRSIILACTHRDEGLRSFSPIPPVELKNISQSGQFKVADLLPSLYRRETPDLMRGPTGTKFITVEEPIAGTELKLLHIEAIEPATKKANDDARLITVAALLVFLIIGTAIYWRATRAARAASDKAALEIAVTNRTAELNAEMAERERADRRFRQAREELAQANRLASLGSITAGLVHEINQPVATIQTLSENAQHHLGKGRLDKVAANLASSIELTSRIGSITQEMRRFARRGHREVVPTNVGELLEETLLIMGDRFRNAGVELEFSDNSTITVLANRVRLEQVLVNLFQNALDAITNHPTPRIVLSIDQDDQFVSITIADNGPGIDPALSDKIFSPFISGKADGLGLGLGIARDIILDLEGTLRIVPSHLGGAAFEVKVKRAKET
ncbi:ATP-binding protein [Brucella pseudogrignonensis]|uniref:sensor histidine kinase n=1 Tax=Brucella pseudogrignonensis TaxID=419475 RepID=UPI0028B3B4BF|nr:ATP-binding protein [Brucella pseudogrignonensis]MDT6940801.1 ATP-binding protein [Brucella pseudogrignonensis]